MDVNLIKGRLNALRRRMKEENIQLYLLTAADFHMSESPAPYFSSIEYMSGFTGSEGKMLITEENAHLWTDSRYMIQAKEELDGTGIILHIYSDYSDEIRTLPMFFGASGEAFFDSLVEEGIAGASFAPHEFKTVIGCDGRTVPFNLIDEIVDNLGIAFDSGAVVINAKVDLIGDIWKGRPSLPCEAVEIIADRYTGEDVSHKLARVREVLSGFGPDAAAVLTSLDDVCWLYNIRGRDMANDLTTLSYGYVSGEDAFLFIDPAKVSGRVREQLINHGVTLRAYDEFYGFLESADNHFIVVDPSRNNAAVVVTIGDKPDTVMLNHEGIVGDLKAVKNMTEQQNAFDTHLTDAVVMVTFIKWIKENAGRADITELSAGRYLDALRGEVGAICPSFPTICAYGEHGAICHYKATEKSDIPIEAEGLLLLDSGGHYYGGTTDIARTIVLGSLTADMKRDFTIALCGLLELADIVFPDGVLDSQLDVVARSPMWRYGVDFDHATGHGVGNMLEVHEGPQAISWRRGRRGVRMCAGMITTDEPGVYRKGKYGVRHKNELLCKRCGDKPDYLDFMTISFVPIDTAAVDTRYMTAEQLGLLNKYNAMVYKVVAPMLDEEPREWLRVQTAPIE